VAWRLQDSGGHLGERTLHGSFPRLRLSDILLSLILPVMGWIDSLLDQLLRGISRRSGFG